jgi:hypothetical protein
MAITDFQCAKITWTPMGLGLPYFFGTKVNKVVIPVPQLTMDQQYRRINEGKIENLQINFTLEGKILQPFDTTNNPLNRPTAAYAFTSLLQEAQKLKDSFSQDGFLQIDSSTTVPILKNSYADGQNQIISRFPCKVQSVQFNPTQDNWTQSLDYTISLLSDANGPCGSGVIDSMSNSWQLTPYEEYPKLTPITGLQGTGNTANVAAVPGFKIVHTISAVGTYTPNEKSKTKPCDGDEIAKIRINNAFNWLKDHFNDGAPTFLSGAKIFDFVRQIDYNIADGSYGLTDSFTWITGANRPGGAEQVKYLDSFSLDTSFDLESDTRSVTVQGNIIGLEEYPFNFDAINASFPIGWTGGTPQQVKLNPTDYVTKGKMASAYEGWLKIESGMYQRAQFATGLFPKSGLANCNISSFGSMKQRLEFLNPVPQSTSVGFNVKEGSISYSYTYNNRPKPIVDCALSESLSLTDNLPTKQTAEIFVIGRKLGPLIQDMGTYSSPTRSVNYEVTLPKASSISGTVFPSNIYKTITGVLNQFDPKYLLPSNSAALTGKVQSFIKENSESWNPLEGRFSKSIAWTYTICDGTVETLSNPNISS